MNTKQIAEEARNEIRSYFNKPYYPNEHENDKVLLIIQAAIEKVDEQWRERFRKFEKIEEKFGSASQRAAHASEPWTDEQVKGTLEAHGISGITRAHNATSQPAYASAEWHPCEHCKQFGKSVKILDANSYSVGEARDWDSAISLCDAHKTAIEKATEEITKDRDLWKRQSAFESEHREKYRQRLIDQAAHASEEK